MATVKPRITITLEPHQHAVLRRMADLQRKSMSSVVTDFLSTALPVIERTAIALESARQAEDSMRDVLVQIAEDTQRTLTPAIADAVDQLDIFIDISEKARKK